MWHSELILLSNVKIFPCKYPLWRQIKRSQRHIYGGCATLCSNELGHWIQTYFAWNFNFYTKQRRIAHIQYILDIEKSFYENIVKLETFTVYVSIIRIGNSIWEIGVTHEESAERNLYRSTIAVTQGLGFPVSLTFTNCSFA
jgi:hypothetical protein